MYLISQWLTLSRSHNINTADELRAVSELENFKVWNVSLMSLDLGRSLNLFNDRKPSGLHPFFEWLYQSKSHSSSCFPLPSMGNNMNLMIWARKFVSILQLLSLLPFKELPCRFYLLNIFKFLPFFNIPTTRLWSRP